MIIRILLITVFAALAACSTEQPEHSMLRSDVAKLKGLPPLSVRKFDVSVTLKDEEKVVISETKSGRLGGLIKFTKQSELVYPSSYSLPDLGKEDGLSENVFPVTPALPIQYKSIQVGWTTELVARHAEGLIILEGGVTHVSTKMDRGVYGEGAEVILAPIKGDFVVITENRSDMPIISRVTYPLNIRMLPGKLYTVTLPDGTKVRVKLDERK